MPEGAHGPQSTNAREECLEAAEQRLLGAREAVRWENEFIAEWKKSKGSTQRLLSNFCRTFNAGSKPLERECRAVREELGIPLDESTNPRPVKEPSATVRAVGIRVEA